MFRYHTGPAETSAGGAGQGSVDKDTSVCMCSRFDVRHPESACCSILHINWPSAAVTSTHLALRAHISHLRVSLHRGVVSRRGGGLLGHKMVLRRGHKLQRRQRACQRRLTRGSHCLHWAPGSWHKTCELSCSSANTSMQGICPGHAALILYAPVTPHPAFQGRSGWRCWRCARCRAAVAAQALTAAAWTGPERGERPGLAAAAGSWTARPLPWPLPPKLGPPQQRRQLPRSCQGFA